MKRHQKQISRTWKHINNPKPGDFFVGWTLGPHLRYLANDIYVLDIIDDEILFFEVCRFPDTPCNILRDGVVKTMPLSTFKDRFKYKIRRIGGHIDIRYRVRYIDNRLDEVKLLMRRLNDKY